MSTTTRHTRLLHGHRMSYLEVDPGLVDDPEVVVLLHGIAGSAEAWSDVLDAYARFSEEHPERGTRRLIVPDMLGHGATAGAGGDFSLGGYANGLRDLLAVLRIRRATLVGHSLGGGVAMQFAYQFPEMCSRLVMISSGGLGRTVSLALRAVALPGAEYVMPVMARTGVLGFWVNGLRLASRLPGVDAVSLREYARHAASLTERAHLAAFVDTVRGIAGPSGQRVNGTDRLYLTEGLPTMIVWGSRDPVVPVGHAKRAAALVPHARLEILEGCGHFPQADEPDRVVTLLTDFFDEFPPATLDVQAMGPRLAAHEAT